MHHLLDDPLPNGVYAPEEAAIVRYARKATRMERIDDETYGALKRHFSTQQIVDLCMTVGVSNVINRFHATFLTDVDESTLEEVGEVCPIPLPLRPGS